MTLDQILVIIVAFYLGVFLCEYANLKFKLIAYPFVLVFSQLKKLINSKENKNANEEENKD